MGNFDITNSKSEKLEESNLTITNSLLMITFESYVKILVRKFMNCQE